MRTKIVYTLVSDEGDNYYEQALMSMHSLRHYHPQSTVVELVVDERTINTLKGKREGIKNYVSLITIIRVPNEFDKKQSSRYLKTNLRKFIKGDYLFIDCDTIICKPLSNIDKIGAPIAMVADLNGKLKLTDKSIIKRCEDGGLGNLEGMPYFNSGVIYAKDTPEVHHFYEEWHKNWKLSAENGVTFDQPALCKTNADNGLIIKELPGVWNCQFKYTQGYKYLSDAYIMHYFNPNGKEAWTYPTDMILERIKATGRIDPITNNLLRHPQTNLYAVMSINKDSAYRFFNSDMTYIYFCQPRLYKTIASISKVLSRFSRFIHFR